MQHINFLKHYLFGNIPILHEHKSLNGVSIFPIIPYLILKKFLHYSFKLRYTPFSTNFQNWEQEGLL